MPAQAPAQLNRRGLATSAPVGCRQAEFAGAHLAGSDLRPLLDLDPGGTSRFGEGGRDEPRIGLAILGSEGATDNQLPQPGKARQQRIAAEGLEIETEAGGVAAMLFDDGHIRLAARQAEMTGDGELAVGADELGQFGPEAQGAPGQGQLAQRATLLAHAAEIDSARPLPGEVALQDRTESPLRRR